ncbi:MAG: SET domain-containing protein-lysine N-methyltransferase [Candidatus Wildermuthbacteria bacterium]|nr:SET domain-containing protein-lysine N-methyltransferase [Candidatus Wildermuthbacteria bacterium]
MNKKTHSFLTPKAKVKNSSILGQGVFAKEKIKKGELVAAWGACVITIKGGGKLPKAIWKIGGYPIQIYDNLWLGPVSVKELDDAEFFNHSCEPNAGVRGQNLLFARRGIKSGEEITFDYGTTDAQLLNFRCACGTKNCRKIVTGNDWRNPLFQKKNKGWFSWYIGEKIKKARR